MNTKIWTDGSCWPNPGGAGGWAWHNGAGAQGVGGAASTTNNRMELTAILEALRAQPAGSAVIVYSDSQYCVNGLTVWSKGWQRRDWMKKGEPMPNRDLWLALECEKHRVQATFLWVRGHAGDQGNERADQLAEAARIAATLN